MSVYALVLSLVCATATDGAEPAAPSASASATAAQTSAAAPTAAAPTAGVASPAADASESGPPRESVADSVFDDGVRAFAGGNLRGAAENFWHYLSGNEPVADHYEWAEFYLAKSLLGLGYTHAGVEFLYNVARDRKRPELLPEALRLLEQVRATKPYDEELVDRDLIAGADFGQLPPDVASFIEYEQGRLDLLADEGGWAARHFERLQHSGDDDARVRIQVGRAELASALSTLRTARRLDGKGRREKREAAITQLSAILDMPGVDDAAKNDARRVLARLMFEDKRFDRALQMYNSIHAPFLSEEEANLFLEKAWARYYSNDPRGTLGILLTLEAPSYRKFFKPERFVLKALAYKQLCHYAEAKAAAREFLRRYGPSLAELRRSRDPLRDPVVRTAAVQRKQPRRTYAFLDSLQRERGMVWLLSDEHGLGRQLSRIYDLKVAEVNRRLDRIVDDEATAVASELLDYEEQARLVDYEVSLEVFRRLKQGSGRAAVIDDDPPIPLGSRDVYYRFDGEYWNDELHDYRFRIENRCFGEGLLQ